MAAARKFCKSLEGKIKFRGEDLGLGRGWGPITQEEQSPADFTIDNVYRKDQSIVLRPSVTMWLLAQVMMLAPTVLAPAMVLDLTMLVTHPPSQKNVKRQVRMCHPGGCVS